MAFRGEVDDVVRLEGLKRIRDRRPVADVDFGEAIVRRVVDRRQRRQIARVGQLVDVQHVDAGADQMPADRGADEARPARYQYVTHVLSPDQEISRAQQAATEARQSGRARS